MNHTTQKGSLLIWILAVISIIIVSGALWYAVDVNNQSTTTPTERTDTETAQFPTTNGPAPTNTTPETGGSDSVPEEPQTGGPGPTPEEPQTGGPGPVPEEPETGGPDPEPGPGEREGEKNEEENNENNGGFNQVDEETGPSNENNSDYIMDVAVDYTDSGFEPQTVTIAIGDTVRFVNQSSGGMWVASDNHPTHREYPGSDISSCDDSAERDLIFDQCESAPAGNFWEYTFFEEGSWDYHNHADSSHGGTVVVVSE